MTRPPEHVTERLNREMYRYYFGGWRMWLVLIALLGALAFLLVPQPVTVTHQTGVVTGVTTLFSESGPRLRVGVQTGDIRVEAGTRARLVAPANGETVCLRRTVGDWTGAETFNLTDMRFCETPDATQTGR